MKEEEKSGRDTPGSSDSMRGMSKSAKRPARKRRQGQQNPPQQPRLMNGQAPMVNLWKYNTFLHAPECDPHYWKNAKNCTAGSNAWTRISRWIPRSTRRDVPSTPPTAATALGLWWSTGSTLLPTSHGSSRSGINIVSVGAFCSDPFHDPMHWVYCTMILGSWPKSQLNIPLHSSLPMEAISCMWRKKKFISGLNRTKIWETSTVTEQTGSVNNA